MKSTLKYAMLLLALLLSLGGQAQRSKEALQKEINSLQKEIESANKLLKETSKNKEATLGQVSLMDQKIRNRQKLINAYNEQIKVLDRNIRQGENNINRLGGELRTMRGEYAKMVLFAYKNRSHYDQLEFLFASEDFNQASRRLRYIRQFADARKTKIDQIAATQRKVSAEVEANRKAREEQAALLAEEKAQQEALKQEKAELNAQVKQLKKKEGSIQQSIKDKQAQAKKFQKQIDDIIAEEIRKANERAAKEAAGKNKGKTTKPDKMALTPTEKALSTSFSANKGKLPWPVERGAVSSSFGKHASAFSDKVTVTNNGVDIATTEKAKARCVFEGVVVSVVKPSASNIGIIIRHGDYFTVYSQLDEAYVNRGDKVKTKQDIGRVHTDRSEGKTELHFELRKGTETLNPSLWLAK
ncbi:MAG: peptidoglycan DD-metalloendopeptidase family protein [Bacteroidales bacterium]|nr:peptidoglycan DD-metalloendopeptidase family protein [Bacteroidales bacterium]